MASSLVLTPAPIVAVAPSASAQTSQAQKPTEGSVRVDMLNGKSLTEVFENYKLRVGQIQQEPSWVSGKTDKTARGKQEWELVKTAIAAKREYYQKTTKGKLASLFNVVKRCVFGSRDAAETVEKELQAASKKFATSIEQGILLTPAELAQAEREAQQCVNDGYGLEKTAKAHNSELERLYKLLSDISFPTLEQIKEIEDLKNEKDELMGYWIAAKQAYNAKKGKEKHDSIPHNKYAEIRTALNNLIAEKRANEIARQEEIAQVAAMEVEQAAREAEARANTGCCARISACAKLTAKAVAFTGLLAAFALSIQETYF